MVRISKEKPLRFSRRVAELLPKSIAMWGAIKSRNEYFSFVEHLLPIALLLTSQANFSYVARMDTNTNTIT